VASSAGRRSNNRSRLDLGAPAAERDIKKGLAAYFIESDAFDRVQRGEKLVIVGNRGAGKSAIFQVLAQRERAVGTYVIELAPEDYSYELLSRTMVSESSGSWAKLGAYAVAWKYLIYVLVMQELTRKGARKQEAASIYRYVRDNYVGGPIGPLSALVSYVKRMEGVKVGPYDATFRTRELEKLYKLAEIAPLLPALVQILEKQRVVVLVDELDRGWDESEDAKAFVAGLFQACTSINGLSDNLRVYISLRQELYDNIPALYEDAQKYRDVMEVISWTKPRLLELIAARIRYSLGNVDDSDERCWRRVFTKSSPEPPASLFDYMVERTHYRPREIIQFCAQAIEEAFERRTGLPIDASTVLSIEGAYSEERTTDIAAEYRFQYPGLLSVFEAFRGRNRFLDYDELSLICLEITTECVVTGPATVWVKDQDPDLVIEILWRVGFFQAAVGGAAQVPGTEVFVGHHQVSRLNLAGVQRFRIHPMFWAYLGLRGAEDRAAER
jgi:energy-coupling factor transporter ATP-binding protein EcfA2